MPSDPSELTTVALLREIQNLEEKLTIRIDGVVDSFKERLSAIDKATDVFKEDLTRVPTQLDRAMSSSRLLTDEQFSRIETRLDGMAKLKQEQFQGIQKQFDERDRREAIQVQAAKEAVAAALAASKEMMGEQAHNIRTITDANQAQISDIKDRITRIEAIAIGQAGQRQEQRETSGATMVLLGLAVTILSVLIGLAMRFVGR